MLTHALLAGLLIATLSLSGSLLFGNARFAHSIHRFIIPLAIGVFLCVAFLELIPETLAQSSENGPLIILLGFLLFYGFSHLLRAFHHHHDDAEAYKKDSATRLLIGDALHNATDGIVIASAFMIDPAIGLLTTIGIALHEIPQEIAEYGVLLHAGYSKRRALLLNFLSALSVFVGIFVTFMFVSLAPTLSYILIGIAAGNLLYIATADLIPELRESHQDHFVQSFATTLIGIILMGSLIHIVHEQIKHAEHGDGHANHEMHADDSSQ
jgi:zinc and cadmium transporter